jgi:hypothetical protein
MSKYGPKTSITFLTGTTIFSEDFKDTSSLPETIPNHKSTEKMYEITVTIPEELISRGHQVTGQSHILHLAHPLKI